MGKKLIFNVGNLKGIADMEGASVILGEPFEKGANPHNLNLKISDDSKSHTTLGYTTDLETLSYIFSLQTLRSSSLTNAKLNDPMEKERVGVTKLASSRFITCFCHTDQECVPFWMNYGKNIRKDKVLMQFNNFANTFDNCIYTDYALLENKKRVLFKSEIYKELVNKQLFDESIHETYDLSTTIDTLMVLDIEYIPCSSEIFKKDYSGDMQIDFERITSQKDATISIHGYDPTSLGKQKSTPWDYEKETRILCSLGSSSSPNWDYIDLRLKPEIFRGMKIILSPWDEGDLRNKVQSFINASSLPKDIKDSIIIIDSELKGKLNFPED